MNNNCGCGMNYGYGTSYAMPASGCGCSDCNAAAVVPMTEGAVVEGAEVTSEAAGETAAPVEESADTPPSPDDA